MDLLSIMSLAGGGALGAAGLGLAFFAIAKMSKAGERESGAWKGKVEEARARILAESGKAMAEGMRDDALRQARQLGADVARERARADSLQDSLNEAHRRLAEQAMEQLHDPDTSLEARAAAASRLLREDVPTTVIPRTITPTGGRRPPR